MNKCIVLSLSVMAILADSGEGKFTSFTKYTRY